jgi:cell wall-associated NlpC family hydrolase
VQAALSQVGKPYQWGGVGPNAYDCSGLTMWAWAHAGVSLPHSSQMQYEATARESQSDWQPGDLLFFGSPIHHVAMSRRQRPDG